MDQKKMMFMLVMAKQLAEMCGAVHSFNEDKSTPTFMSWYALYIAGIGMFHEGIPNTGKLPMFITKDELDEIMPLLEKIKSRVEDYKSEIMDEKEKEAVDAAVKELIRDVNKNLN